MVKFGQYLKHNIVPEWRDKFIDYKGLKKILKQSGEDRANVDIEMAPIRVSDIYSKEVEEKNFRRIDNKETEGMIHLDGKKISTVGDATYSTFTAVPEGKLNEALLIRTNRSLSQWESPDGSVSYSWILPSISSPKERQFFEKLKVEIQMVNKWYVEKLNECKTECTKYDEQVKKYIQESKEHSTTRESRQLEFGLKELYRLLEYLHNYCTLNRTAIDKILKKHDKQSEFQSRGTVMVALQDLSFYKEKEVTQLRGYVEILWRKFKGKESSKTMFELKNLNSKISSQNAFQIGCFVGACIVLCCILLLLITQYPLDLPSNQKSLLFLIIRFQVFLILQQWGWFADLYIFYHNRINYEYIFGQYYPSLLHYQHQAYYASLFSLVNLIVIVIWFYLSFIKELIPDTCIVIIIPLLFLITILFILPLPEYQYYQARGYMLKHCLSIFAVPFYHVQFPDFFLGDQLTSHNQTVFDFFHLLCLFISGSFITFEDSSFFLQNQSYFRFIASFLPPFIRFAQCLRRFYDTHDKYPHLYNGIKYSLSLIAVCCSWNKIAFILFQSIYTCYALNWDLREDWGLLQNWVKGKWFLLRKGDNNGMNEDDLKVSSKETALRSKHLLAERWYYYCALIVNTVMRLLWIVKLCVEPSLGSDWTGLVFGCLEILRRCIWNVFRMENEQVNNCGKFRATLEVPLPFPDLLFVCLMNCL